MRLSSMAGEVCPQAVSVNDFFIPAQLTVKVFALLLQLPGAEITTDGLIFAEFHPGSCELCFQIGNCVF